MNFRMNEIRLDNIDVDSLRKKTFNVNDIYEVLDREHVDYRVFGFMIRYQHLFTKIVKCWDYYNNKIIVDLDNGDSYLYDDSIPKAFKLKFFDRISELSDDEWRIGFGYRLEELIWQRGIRKEELSENVGITLSMLNRYIKGSAIPSLNIACRISEALNCDINDLIPKYFVPM